MNPSDDFDVKFRVRFRRACFRRPGRDLDYADLTRLPGRGCSRCQLLPEFAASIEAREDTHD